MMLTPSHVAEAAAVAELAHSNLIETLGRFSNDVGTKHSDALRLMLGDLAAMAYGVLGGRRAYPLGCGLGKTQSVVALCAALHTLGSGRSVAISASKVEALCELKRHMIDHGIPEESIGLTHCYKHDAEKAGKVDGFASLPCTKDNDKRQFHLVTHQRIRGRTPLANYYTYNGRPRDLLIWDESLLVSDARTLSLMGLQRSLGWMTPVIGMASPVRVYLQMALDTLGAELQRQSVAGADKQPRPVILPALDDITIGAFKGKLTADELAEPLKQLLEMSQEPLRALTTTQGSGLITYDITVPRALESIAILDASYPIRELERMDASITLGLQADVTAGIKRYDHVQLFHLNAPSGRSKMTEDFTKGRVVAAEVCDVVKQIPADEAVIIWTFKEKIDWRKRKVNFKGIIERTLADAGVDTKATVPVTRWKDGEAITVDEPRIVWRSWGQECSDSAFAYASNQVFSGVIHRSYLDIASSACGQRDDKWATLEHSELRRIMLSETTHSILQALNRGSCRIIEGNQARHMKAWLFHRDANLRGELEKVMPGMKWLPWETKFLCAGIGSRTIARIGEFLESLPADVKRVSVQSMKAQIGLSASEARTTFSQSLSKYLKDGVDWERDGRSLVRTWDWSKEPGEPEAAPVATIGAPSAPSQQQEAAP